MSSVLIGTCFLIVLRSPRGVSELGTGDLAFAYHSPLLPVSNLIDLPP